MDKKGNSVVVDSPERLGESLKGHIAPNVATKWVALSETLWVIFAERTPAPLDDVDESPHVPKWDVIFAEWLCELGWYI